MPEIRNVFRHFAFKQNWLGSKHSFGGITFGDDLSIPVLYKNGGKYARHQSVRFPVIKNRRFGGNKHPHIACRPPAFTRTQSSRIISPSSRSNYHWIYDPNGVVSGPRLHAINRSCQIQAAFLTFAMSTASRLADGVLAGCRLSLSRAITLIESQNRAHAAHAAELLDRVSASAAHQPTFRVGSLGRRASEKSTLIERLGMHIASEQTPVAVLTVDPSSTLSRGSILGDKTRMAALAQHPFAYVRPSPSRGVLGGLARRTDEAVALCEAAGHSIVIVETVGVGQSEVAVSDAVDVLLLLVAPAGGDDVQGFKKGVLEFADLVVVNKADGTMAATARDTARDFRASVGLARQRRNRTIPRVVLHSVKKRLEERDRAESNVDEVLSTEELWTAVEEIRENLVTNGELESNRKQQRERWMWSEIRSELEARLLIARL